jgi:hypothetical protein
VNVKLDGADREVELHLNSQGEISNSANVSPESPESPESMETSDPNDLSTWSPLRKPTMADAMLPKPGPSWVVQDEWEEESQLPEKKDIDNEQFAEMDYSEFLYRKEKALEAKFGRKERPMVPFVDPFQQKDVQGLSRGAQAPPKEVGARPKMIERSVSPVRWDDEECHTKEWYLRHGYSPLYATWMTAPHPYHGLAAVPPIPRGNHRWKPTDRAQQQAKPYNRPRIPNNPKGFRPVQNPPGSGSARTIERKQKRIYKKVAQARETLAKYGDRY